MKQFTRFENQYILMLASQAKRELKKAQKDDGSFGVGTEIGTNINNYISTLEDIIVKAKFNMDEFEDDDEK